MENWSFLFAFLLNLVSSSLLDDSALNSYLNDVLIKRHDPGRGKFWESARNDQRFKSGIGNFRSFKRAIEIGKMSPPHMRPTTRFVLQNSDGAHQTDQEQDWDLNRFERIFENIVRQKEKSGYLNPRFVVKRQVFSEPLNTEVEAVKYPWEYLENMSRMVKKMMKARNDADVIYKNPGSSTMMNMLSGVSLK